MAIEQEAFTAVCSWYLTTQECAMNAFVEHHNNSIQFGYRCFDRLLLNGLIQPFQHPERVLGFFNTYRQGKRVTRRALTEIADQFQNWLKNRSEKWGADSRTSRRRWRREPAKQVRGAIFPGCQTEPSRGDPESTRASPH